MDYNKFDEVRYKRAKKRIKCIQGFYWHLFWYLAVNLFLTFGETLKSMLNGDSFEFVAFNFGTFSIWFYWGIGLMMHWFNVFGKNMLFSNNWEDRKINEYLDKDIGDY